MIILPDRNIPRARFLLPVYRREWMPSSQAMFKDQFGNPGVQTRFRVRARLDDGHVVWRGFFDDRDDFDAFLWAIATGSLRYERELWRLPTPHWHPDLGEHLTFDFATITFLTTTGSNQTYTSPSDWNNSNNTVECIGSGASGGAIRASGGAAAGGGTGGNYSLINDFSFATPGTTTATYNVGAGASAITDTGGGTNGAAGNPTWFNNATNPGNGSNNTKCSAVGGVAGKMSNGGNTTSTNATATTAAWGQTKHKAGNVGTAAGTSGAGASGGSGAGGPNGDGATSANAGTNVAGSGSQGGNGSGGAGGGAGTNGSGGTEFDASHGSGGGGGGNRSITSGTFTAGSGGNYGAGGGGAAIAASSSTAVSGAGAQGIIVVTYTPNSILGSPNLAMIGM